MYKEFISLCMIVKDDEELLGLIGAVDSIKEYVDEVCITANGSETKEIESYCKQNNYKYSFIKWDDDFAKVRNFSFEQASSKATWIFWMDADDVLVGGEHLMWLAHTASKTSKDCVFLPYWYSCQFNGVPSADTIKSVNLRQMRERLMRPKKYNWVGRLHETPLAVEGAKNDYTAFREDSVEGKEIAVIHLSTLHNMDAKMDRNIRIMNKELEDELKKGGADPRTLLYLIKMIAEYPKSTKEDYEKAIEYAKEYQLKSGWDEERASCHEHVSICYALMNNTKKAREHLYLAIEEWPHNPLLYLRLANNYYNDKNYRQARHWLEVASNVDLDNKVTSGMVNIQACKAMSAELALKLAYHQEKDIDKAVRYAEMLFSVAPTPDNEENLYFLKDKQLANNACKNVVDLVKYIKETNDTKSIEGILDNLPGFMKDLEFVTKLKQDVLPPRKWARDEICYFANFGTSHYEKWDESSLEKGIGGSETAVIRLSQEWAKLGWKVTVYGDPIKEGTRDGITWLPYTKFNWKDSFNIFISWRSWGLSEKIKARKFLVDLHDVFSPVDITKSQIQHVDKFMVKSKYHRGLAPLIDDKKFSVISNGIDL